MLLGTFLALLTWALLRFIIVVSVFSLYQMVECPSHTNILLWFYFCALVCLIILDKVSYRKVIQVI